MVWLIGYGLKRSWDVVVRNIKKIEKNSEKTYKNRKNNTEIPYF